MRFLLLLFVLYAIALSVGLAYAGFRSPTATAGGLRRSSRAWTGGSDLCAWPQAILPADQDSVRRNRQPSAGNADSRSVAICLRDFSWHWRQCGTHGSLLHA